MTMDEGEVVKENVSPRASLSTWWLAGSLAAMVLALAAAARFDRALPEPLTRANAPPDRFVAETAYEHLVNLTAIGPRVAGSYENEVLAVSTLVAAVRRAAAAASPHNRVELDVHTASGAFPLTFLDGMNNVYRDVQSVVVRVSGVGGGGGGGSRSALLLNCHFDTVPDSPGASDDGAGCAVLLETLRALAAARRPLRHDAVFLFNGAEENIMQASHGFITQHRWARRVRAFINIEACGAGGREVLFQAGPRDPWIVEVYAGEVPHPFASSLAQELFESGLIPADTDFRIFRDFGGLSGVDLAWSSNGYVYHTRLDTAERVPRASLQRTGDNVLALARGLLASEALESEVDASSRQPVFFDVLGLCVVSARAPAAAAAAALVVALVALKVRLSARDARRRLAVARGAWLARVASAALAGAAAQAAGAAAAVLAALLLHAAGARLAFYSRVELLAPLYALPALAGSWWVAARLGGGGPGGRGWWRARAWHDAGCAAAALALAACALRGLRSGFLPLLWAALPAAADAAASLARAGGGARAAAWAAGAALPLLQTCYLALGSLGTLVPLVGRAGVGPVPPDVSMAALVALLTLTASVWTLPLVVAAGHPRRLACGLAALSAAACVLAASTPLGAPYGPERPQRFMVFHTRRTLHAPPGEGEAREESFYWLPDLDVNAPHSVDAAVPEMAAARAVAGAECTRWLYCGAPYHLPALSLVGGSHRLPAPHAPLARLHAELRARRLNDTVRELTLDMTGPSHVVAIVAPAAGCRVSWSSAVAAPQQGPRWGARRTYFFLLHDARAARGEGRASWRLTLHVQHARGAAPPHWADVSLAGHAQFGAAALHDDQRRLLASFPPWVAATGWGVDLHLYRV